MAATLTVHLKRDGTYQVEAPGSFDAGDSFRVLLENHGSPAHVHLHVDDDLARVASIDAANHFVRGDAARSVEVTVQQPPEEVTGLLTVSVGHGAEKSSVAVTVRGAGSGVQVDERLGKPAPRKAEREPRPFPIAAPMLALVAITVLLALATAFVLGDVLGVLIALGVVGTSLVVTAYVLSS